MRRRIRRAYLVAQFEYLNRGHGVTFAVGVMAGAVAMAWLARFAVYLHSVIA